MMFQPSFIKIDPKSYVVTSNIHLQGEVLTDLVSIFIGRVENTLQVHKPEHTNVIQ